MPSPTLFRHILLCNLLTTMLRPNFEDPFDTVQQLIDNNITVVLTPGADLWKQFMSKSSILKYNHLAEQTVESTDFDDYIFNYLQQALCTGDYAVMVSELPDWAVEYLDLTAKGCPEILPNRVWYRSKETLEGKYPYGGYISNKKWYLNEVLKYAS